MSYKGIKGKQITCIFTPTPVSHDEKVQPKPSGSLGCQLALGFRVSGLRFRARGLLQFLPGPWKSYLFWHMLYEAVSNNQPKQTTPRVVQDR